MKNTNSYSGENQENQIAGNVNNQAMNQTTGQAENTLANSYTTTQFQQANVSNQTTSGTMQANQGNAQGVKSVIGMFDSRHNAEQAVKALRTQGFTTEEINIVSKKNNQQQGQHGDYFEDDISDGTLTGGTIGGIGGLLLGAGALAIPGVGPILAAGPIAAALSGAVAGGIVGGLIDWGIPAEAGKRYEQHVVQGGILTIIRSDATKANQAAQILRQNGAKDVETHALG